MVFTNLQIGTILFSFLTALILAILWQKRDKALNKNFENQEHFGVLMSVFFWSAFLGFALKLGLDFLKNINFQYIDSIFFTWFSIGMEEFVKICALVIGLEIAGKKFNQISDGVIYGIFAVLGFLFFENIFYLLAYWDFANGVWNFAGLGIERNIFSFGIHLSTLIFSVFYATAYLKCDICKEKRAKPWDLHKHFKNSKKMFFTLLLSFLGAIVLHIFLNFLIGLGDIFTFLGLVFSGFISFFIFRRFHKLDK